MDNRVEWENIDNTEDNQGELFKQYSADSTVPPNKTRTLEEEIAYQKNRSNIDIREKIINVWNETQEKNMVLRTKLAKFICFVLFIQLCVVDVIIFTVGFKVITLSESLIIGTIIKGFLEIAGFMYIVVNYLFKPIDEEMKKLLECLKMD